MLALKNCMKWLNFREFYSLIIIKMRAWKITQHKNKNQPAAGRLTMTMDEHSTMCNSNCNRKCVYLIKMHISIKLHVLYDFNCSNLQFQYFKLLTFFMVVNKINNRTLEIFVQFWSYICFDLIFDIQMRLNNQPMKYKTSHFQCKTNLFTEKDISGNENVM